jgi:mono/diheme cytochrome c family protein
MITAIGIAAPSGMFVNVQADEHEKKVDSWKKTYEEKILPIVEARCVQCHRGDKIEGEFDFGKFPNGQAAADAGDAWERVAKRIRLNEMPPQGSPGLSDEQKGQFHRWVDSRPNQDLCKQLASEETQSWYRGFVMSRRLTQTEYRNAIRDIVGIPLQPDEEPPSDGAGGEGFDTVGDALFTSTIHLESYLAIADRVIEGALPDAQASDDPAKAAIRNRLLTVLPKSLQPDSSMSDAEAAAEIIAQFARRAWRRPVTDDEKLRLMQLYEASTGRGRGFLASVREPLKAVLVSPHFLFVVETEPDATGVIRLTPHQIATRLALFIWSSVPDEELLQAADSEVILNDDQIRLQVRRMLADPKTRALGENFGLQWLGLRGFSEVHPDGELFPEYAETLSSDLREEAARFVAHVFQQNRPLTDLVAADYVLVNGRLAQHYQIDLPAESPWQTVSVADGRRGGVVTLGSVLTATSYPRRTSPVLRGRWILEEVLGSNVPAPPPNVPALEENTASTEGLTLRQRLDLHRQKAECASCHDRMDPLGFGLENFDGIGRWRDIDNGQPIDNAGKLPSGDSFSGPNELKSVLMKRSGEFQQHFVRKLLGFALGRELNKFDQCIMEACLKKLSENEFKSQILIEEIALSYPFQYRYHKQPTEAPEPPTTSQVLFDRLEQIARKANALKKQADALQESKP